FIEVGGLERVLELSLAEASADAVILDGLEKEVETGHLGEASAQPGDDGVGGYLALAQRFQRDEHAAIVDSAVSGCRADEGTQRGDRGIVQNDSGRFILQR